ncbi:MAG: serine/threonine protein kinase [Myxococcales bacterium]|nr:serine/threonine protein kinase [Myxococcales bacterium]
MTEAILAPHVAITIPEQDESLSSLGQLEIPSLREPGVSFRLGVLLGSGAMGIAYFGMRHAADGKSPVVIKLLKPGYVLQAGDTAKLVVQKEATALSRLNNRVPPTPFVVRMIDTGVLPVVFSGRRLELPWLALEYVHGGVEGTTLTERVAYSVDKTGHAFDPQRAALAVECIAKGVEAVHDVGVIHRDLTPNNVLCCGFGDSEIFKITDFGLARPLGMNATFGGIVVGTVGYAPPEQAALDDRRIGTWSDVFTFAVDLYFMLTGRGYFPTRNAMDSLALIRSPERTSILESAMLSPELREQPAACAGIDLALKLATASRPEDRPKTAPMFASMVLPWLKAGPRSKPVTSRRIESVAPMAAPEPAVGSTWRWTVRHLPGDDQVVRSVAWDGDGRCLCATNQGLRFWNGTGWLAAPMDELPNERGIRFVQRASAGSWLVGGDQATLATYSADGVSEVVRGPSRDVSFSHASGEFSDLAVVVGESEGRPPVLYALSSHRWLKPLSLPDVARVSDIARIGDDRWLIVGRRQDGAGFAALYQPLLWEVRMLDIPRVRALLSCAGRSDRRVGVATGSEGLVICVDDSGESHWFLKGKPDLPAAAVDVAGRIWASGAGGIFLRDTGSDRFEPVWEDPTWVTPIVSLFADLGFVIAMSADGGILEGTRTAADPVGSTQRAT